MTRFKIILFQLCLLFVLSCKQNKNEENKVKWKKEIIDAETKFANFLKEKGMHDAFVAFAADDAVLMRNNDLVIGKEAIDKRYSNLNSKNLDWKPDFVEVSNSGDLAYTYGKYYYTYKDSIGNEQVDTGIFHTVWKRQNDGSWKYVWD
jgi:ketosteroid isomerase-like protein